MSNIISKLDKRYSKLDIIYSKYNYDNMIKEFDRGVYYYIPPELVIEEYYTELIWVAPKIHDWDKCNWVSRFYYSKIVRESTGLNVQDIFDLCILHINDINLRPKCGSPKCTKFVPFKSIYYGYGVGNHIWTEKRKSYCSAECRAHSNFDSLVEWATSDEGRLLSSKTCKLRNSDPKFQSIASYSKLTNNNINLYFYLAISNIDGIKYLKYGCCNDLDTRFNYARNFDGYITIHEIYHADAISVSMLEWTIKESYNYEEYVDFTEIHNVIQIIKSYRKSLKSRKLKKVKKVTKISVTKKVYDLTTTHSYHNFVLGNGIVVHNCGKSLFMQSEAVNFVEQGKRVHYLTLGDLNELDMAIRMICQISHCSQRQVESDIAYYFNKYKDLFKDYLGLTVVPSGKVTAFDYVEWMKQRINEFDVLFIDYDSNFAQDESKSMYERGGDVYDCLTELSRAGKLVFVASQPNKAYFREEYLPYEAIAESSRKVHIADMIITIGRRWESAVPMGIFNIAKLRRGNEDCEKTQKYIRTNDGLFYCCSDALYTKYRSNTTQKARFSFEELKGMDILDNTISDLMPSTLE